MNERNLGNYCPEPTPEPHDHPRTPVTLYAVTYQPVGAYTALAGILSDGTKFGSQTDLNRLEAVVTPHTYFTFDETGTHATCYIEWHRMRFSRRMAIERMRQDLAHFAPELSEPFEEAYESVKGCFRPLAQGIPE